MKLTFAGAAGTVTGSRYLLQGGGRTVLVDFGPFQGYKQVPLPHRLPLPVAAPPPPASPSPPYTLANHLRLSTPRSPQTTLPEAG